MATERLSMRQTREILRQKWGLGRTHREVAQSLRISTGAVGTTVLRARAAGLDWAQVDALSDDVLSDQTTGLRIVFRKWAPGTDPASQGNGVIDGKAKELPGGSSKDERIVGGPGHHPTRDT